MRAEGLTLSNYLAQDLAGWGNFPRQRCHTYRPAHQREVAQLIDHDDSSSLISQGLGRS